MVIAASTTQTPVLAGAGEGSWTRRKFPSAGVRFRQPPLPELRLGERWGSIFGGSCTVVAMLLTSSYCFLLQPHAAITSRRTQSEFAPANSALHNRHWSPRCRTDTDRGKPPEAFPQSYRAVAA